MLKRDKLTDLSPSAITEVVKHKIEKGTASPEDLRMGSVAANNAGKEADARAIAESQVPTATTTAAKGLADTAYRDRRSVEGSV